MSKYDDTLEAEGYRVLFAVGFSEFAGHYRLHMASSPVLRDLSQETWESVRERVIALLDKMRIAPLDDLRMR